MRETAVVIGGGAAGMFAAVQLAKNGLSVTLLEKNEKLGKKIFITGKGRCNFTNACDEETFFGAVQRNPRFLYSAYAAFSSDDTMRFFETAGMPVKVERGRRAFPVSDHAYDVTDALKRQLKKYGVKVVLHAEVTDLLTEPISVGEEECLTESASAGDTSNPADSGSGAETTGKPAEPKSRKKAKKKKQEKPEVRVTGVRYKRTDERGGEEILPADRVIVATGGLSYRTTGSTGDGYRFAETAGHTITKRVPSLVPFLTKEDVSAMAGLSLKNVTLTLWDENRELYSGFGEMLFTHKGISGPLVLTASSIVAGTDRETDENGDDRREQHFLKTLRAEINLKPAVAEDEFEERIVRIFTEEPNKNVSNVLRELVPASMIEPILAVSGTDGERKVNSITKAERLSLVSAIRHFPLTIVGTAGFAEAVITKGGVSVKELDPKTMASKKAEGLYFAGEVIDVDAFTGGFNLQIAWSTAFAAGNAQENKQN